MKSGRVPECHQPLRGVTKRALEPMGAHYALEAEAIAQTGEGVPTRISSCKRTSAKLRIPRNRVPANPAICERGQFAN